MTRRISAFLLFALLFILIGTAESGARAAVTVAWGAIAQLLGRGHAFAAEKQRVSIPDDVCCVFSFADRGSTSVATGGTNSSARSGYAQVDPGINQTVPAGVMILQYRPKDIFVSETAMPAVGLTSEGRTFIETGAFVDTGIAIANPGAQDSTISFYFMDEAGINVRSGRLVVPANRQIAKFLTEEPFRVSTPWNGTFTFSASSPVGVIALRGLINERSEFLWSTVPVVALTPTLTGPLWLPHFADGGGWTTQLVLFNTTDQTLAGVVQFQSQDSPSDPGRAMVLTANGRTDSAFPYSIPPGSSIRLRTSGTLPQALTGSVQVIPASSSNFPAGVALLSFRSAGVTVTETSVPLIRPGSAFRLPVESSGAGGKVGSVQSAIAVENPASEPTAVTFEMTADDGSSVGSTSQMTIPAKGRIALFLNQIPGLENLSNPIEGILRVSSPGPVGISIIALRTRVNERGDFLITATPVVNESSVAVTSPSFFPHFVDGGGYTSRFVLFSGTFGQSSRGLLHFFSGGVPVNPPLGHPRYPVADFSMSANGQTVSAPSLLIATVDSGSAATVSFNAAGSYDPEARSLKYIWRRGTDQLAVDRSFAKSFPIGNHTITLTVTNDVNSASISARLQVQQKQVGNIRVEATLNGVPWSGPADFNLVSSDTSISRNSVPSVITDAVPGFYTVALTGGGPDGATLPSVLPGASQSVSANQTTVFILNFARRLGAFSLTASARCIGTTPAIDLHWTSAAYATAYQLSIDGSSRPITGSSYTDTPVAAGRSYTYIVTASDSYAATLNSNAVIITASACVPVAYKADGIAFSPWLDGQNPNQGSKATEDQIRDRISIIAPYTNWIRTFGSTSGLEKTAEIALKFGLKTAIGAWIGRDAAANDREISSLITAAKAGQADIAIVGNEVLLRGDVSEAQLIEYMRRVKREVPSVPITTAEVYGILEAHPAVLSESDVVMANVYPFWESVKLENAIASVHRSYAELKASAGGKQVIVSESGWPSCGSHGDAVGSPANASSYFLNFVSWARANNIRYFYFAGFDEAWKTASEGPQGACWGIWDKAGNMKPGMSDVFNGKTIANNWDPTISPCEAGASKIKFTYVPKYGSFDDLKGAVCDVNPWDYSVVVYIRVGGWWIKPFADRPLTRIDNDSSWTTDITTGGVDQTATEIAAYLLHNGGGFKPPILLGDAAIPSTLDQNSLAQARIQRTVCLYSISPPTQIIAADGHGGDVAVTVNTGCDWKAVSNNSWITLLSGASGNGNGSVQYVVAPNTSGTSRTGTMTIAGQTFTITQADEGISCGSDPTLSYGTTVLCSMPAARTDTYIATGSIGDVVALELSALSGLNFLPCMDLIGPDNSRTTACAFSVFNRIDQTLSLSGSYRIVVRGSVAGAYSLSLENRNPPSPRARRIQYGSGVTGEIAPPGDLDLIYFEEGRAGDIIRVNATTLGGLNFLPCIELNAPDGKRSLSCAYWTPARIDLTLSVSGRYSILIRNSVGAYGPVAGGKYSVTVDCLGGPCAASPVEKSIRR